MLEMFGWPKYCLTYSYTLRKHANSNILKILQPKEKFQIKNSDIFRDPAQNIDCGSNEYPQSMLYNKIIKIMYNPVNPNFTI